MPEPDIWELDQHSHGTNTTASSDGGSGTLETTTTASSEGGPIVALIDSSSWTRDDVELALELAQLIVYASLAYAVLTNE